MRWNVFDYFNQDLHLSFLFPQCGVCMYLWMQDPLVFCNKRWQSNLVEVMILLSSERCLLEPPGNITIMKYGITLKGQITKKTFKLSLNSSLLIWNLYYLRSSVKHKILGKILETSNHRLPGYLYFLHWKSVVTGSAFFTISFVFNKKKKLLWISKRRVNLHFWVNDLFKCSGWFILLHQDQQKICFGAAFAFSSKCYCTSQRCVVQALWLVGLIALQWHSGRTDHYISTPGIHFVWS